MVKLRVRRDAPADAIAADILSQRFRISLGQAYVIMGEAEHRIEQDYRPKADGDTTSKPYFEVFNGRYYVVFRKRNDGVMAVYRVTIGPTSESIHFRRLKHIPDGLATAQLVLTWKE